MGYTHKSRIVLSKKRIRTNTHTMSKEVKDTKMAALAIGLIFVITQLLSKFIFN